MATISKQKKDSKIYGEAYNTLGNARQRRKYDRLWYYYIGRKNKQNKDYRNAKTKDFIGLFFGEKRAKEQKEERPSKHEPERGEDIYTEITSTIVEAYFGATKEITFRTIDGGSKKINVKIPSGIRNEEKIRVIGQGKKRQKWRQKWRLIYKNKNKKYEIAKIRRYRYIYRPTNNSMGISTRS